MRYKAKIAATVALPNNPGLVGTIIRGAMAWKAGQPLTVNPYEADTAPGFYAAWERGWKLARVGLITAKDSDTRERRFCKEIERV